MNKIISVILLLSLLLVFFTGCSVPDNNDDEIPEENPQTELQSTDELILALIKYLDERLMSASAIPTSTAKKINRIKNGEQPLHVAFNPSDCYFVCGYYNGEHKNEVHHYCCKEEYTWLKFESADEIIEQYKDNGFVVAFQINKASFVTDILSEDNEVPNFEHFQPYTPVFENGLNTEVSLVFDETFIYLNSSDKSNVYYYEGALNNVWVTLPCIYLDGKYYFKKELYTIHHNGENSGSDIVYDFGEYYDALVDVMDTERYRVTHENGRVDYYGLIKIQDLAKCINEYNGTGYVMQLNSLFAKLQEDAETLEKIEFYVEFKDRHYELKESGEYDNDSWSNPFIQVFIDCNYDLAVDEDWYKECQDTKYETLNTALFNQYSNELSDGHFTPLGILSALFFKYVHSEETISETLTVFYSDYNVLKRLIDLEYVNCICITYRYSMPSRFFAE